MIVIERQIQEIYPGKNEALVELDGRYAPINESYGFTPIKRYWCISGPHDINTSVFERQWESMAAMEAAYENSFDHPDIQALNAEGADIIKSSRIELYTPAQ